MAFDVLHPARSATLALTAMAAVLAFAAPEEAHALQRRGQAGGTPKVGVIQSIGCSETKGANPTTWWLTHAAEAKATATTFFNATEIEDAKALALGTNAYQLLGVADFLDVDGLLQQGQRSQFTTRETANASGQLRAGRKVVVKGLFVEGADGQKRINLTQVVSVSDSCQ